MTRKRFLSLLGVILSMALFLSGQRNDPRLVSVVGRVYDPASMRALPGVEVSWKATKVRSDTAGRYQIKVLNGVRELSFSAPGRPTVRKALVIRRPDQAITLDVLLAN